MNRRTRNRLFELAVLAGPFAAIVIAKELVGGGPAPAPAATVTSAAPPAVPVPAPTAPATDEQRRALEWLEARARASISGSPMDHPAIAPEPEDEGPATPEPSSPALAVDPLEGLRLTAASGSGARAVAVIAGKVHRQGDEIIPGYRIRAIDGRAFTVEVVGPDGAVRTLTRDR